MAWQELKVLQVFKAYWESQKQDEHIKVETQDSGRKRQLAESKKGAFGRDGVRGWRQGAQDEPASVLLATEHLICALLKPMRGLSSMDYD